MMWTCGGPMPEDRTACHSSPEYMAAQSFSGRLSDNRHSVIASEPARPSDRTGPREVRRAIWLMTSGITPDLRRISQNR